MTYKDAKLDQGVEKMRAWLRGRGWVKQRDLQRACVGGARTKSEQHSLYKHYQEVYPSHYNDGSYRA